MATVRVVLNPAALYSLLGAPGSPTSRYMLRKGVLVSNAAKVLCPVDTGRLRASIGVSQTFTARGSVTVVGTNVEYGGFIEYGTSRQRAQPYLRPALAAVRASS